MPRLFSALLLSLLLSQGVGAQDASERWYKVELLVFEQPNGLNAEQWNPLPELRYPDALRFLVDPRQLEAARNRYGSASHVDSRGRIVAATTAPGLGGVHADALGAPEDATPLPSAFVKLPNAEQELRDTAAYMQRAGGYRTLFHEAWLQPVTDASRAIPLALDTSGDTPTWPELQGTITLSLARFLSLETNLWLNTQGNYLPSGWQMPAPPKAPPALLLNSPLLDDGSAAAPVAGATQGNLGTVQSSPQQKAGDGIAEAPYPYRHAVLHQQTRRMRSNQMHYLDHPLLGVIIKLTPLETGEVAEPAQDE
ncbi:MAG: hypothetical protein KDI09_00865 [Halioglobus sp.]|nr:hypothetical protein [Halioglobus sp.]